MVTMTNLIFVALLIGIAVSVATIVDMIRKVGKLQEIRDKISFMESMNLVDLPIITFFIKNVGGNDIRLNFLLDTGSNKNHINTSVLPNITYTESNKEESVLGMEGNRVINQIVGMTISYKDKQFTDEFMTTDLDTAFDVIKQENGVQIHGILGSVFFQRYKYILDFDELVAYSRT